MEFLNDAEHRYVEVTRNAFTGRLRDGRNYIQDWQGWLIRKYHWVEPRVKRWIDALIAIGPTSLETATNLGSYYGIKREAVNLIIEDLRLKGLLRDSLRSEAVSDSNTYRTETLNLGALPHSHIEGHFNNELLRTNSPYFVKFEISTVCNLRCGYCYVKEMDAEYVELSNAIKLLRRLKEGGVVELSLTGLEATLHPDIDRIITTADKLGFRVALLTNGLVLKQTLIAALKQCRRTEVRISYHSDDNEQFDAFTGRKGAGEAVWSNLLRLRDEGIPVVATVVLNSANEHLVRGTVQRLIEQGIPYVVSNIILPYVNGKLDPLGANVYLPSVGVVADLVLDGTTHRRRRECTALRSKAWLGSNGDLFPCELTKTAPIGNLLGSELKELWASTGAEALRSRYGAEPTQCVSCTASAGCPRCPALSEAENGAPNTVYSIFCETTGEIETRKDPAGKKFSPPKPPPGRIVRASLPVLMSR